MIRLNSTPNVGAKGNSMFDFGDQTVLVTGASGSIGSAIARAFAEAGTRVALHYGRNREAAEQIHESLPGDGHLLVQADIADGASVEQMMNTVVDRFGRLNILVNNAATYREHAVEQVDYAQWQQVW